MTNHHGGKSRLFRPFDGKSEKGQVSVYEQWDEMRDKLTRYASRKVWGPKFLAAIDIRTTEGDEAFLQHWNAMDWTVSGRWVFINRIGLLRTQGRTANPSRDEEYDEREIVHLSEELDSACQGNANIAIRNKLQLHEMVRALDGVYRRKTAMGRRQVMNQVMTGPMGHLEPADGCACCWSAELGAVGRHQAGVSEDG